MKNLKYLFYACLPLSIGITSCSDKDNDEPLVSADYTHGVLVTNEGSFSSGTGTITYFDRFYKAVTNNVFENENGYPLGNVVQSLGFAGSKVYIVVNNAQKVVVADAKTFQFAGVIDSVFQPRYFLSAGSGKGYISEWVDGSEGNIKVVDLNSNQILKTIVAGKGSDRMLQSGNYVFVCNAGGYDPNTYDPVNDSAVSVIDVNGDSLYMRIPTGYNPGGIVEDIYGKLWVICYGISDYNNVSNNRPGSLVRINPTTMAVELTLPFSSNDLGMRITINGNKYKLYYQYQGQVFEMPVTASVLPSMPLINRNFYALGFDPETNYIYGSDAGNFNANGYVIRYDESGAVVDSFMTGIGPGNFTFLPQ